MSSLSVRSHDGGYRDGPLRHPSSGQIERDPEVYTVGDLIRASHRSDPEAKVLSVEEVLAIPQARSMTGVARWYDEIKWKALYWLRGYGTKIASGNPSWVVHLTDDLVGAERG